jgi:molecular chaperone GrpE
MADKDVRDPYENERDIDINADENMSGTSHLNEPLQDDSELDKLKGELDAQKDKYLRLQAEFDNFRRRSAKERIELMQTAGKDVISDMLEVMDDAERA